MDSTVLKQKLRDIAPGVFEKTPVRFAYLYGSYATGDPHPFSDLDIAVFVEGLSPRAGLDLGLSLSLKIDEALDHAVQSELRIINHLPLTIKGRILVDGMIIYSADEPKRVEFETQTRLVYFDFLPVIQQHQKMYLQKVLSGA